MCARQPHIVARFRAPCLTSIATKGHTMITIEKAKATAQMLVNRYTDLTNAEEIVRKAIQEEIVNEKDALAIWGRVRNITKN
jgi:cobalamin biosynthesis protein CobD/CbiB